MTSTAPNANANAAHLNTSSSRPRKRIAPTPVPGLWFPPDTFSHLGFYGVPVGEPLVLSSLPSPSPSPSPSNESVSTIYSNDESASQVSLGDWESMEALDRKKSDGESDGEKIGSDMGDEKGHSEKIGSLDLDLSELPKKQGERGQGESKKGNKTGAEKSYGENMGSSLGFGIGGDYDSEASSDNFDFSDKKTGKQGEGKGKRKSKKSNKAGGNKANEEAKKTKRKYDDLETGSEIEVARKPAPKRTLRSKKKDIKKYYG